MRFPTTPKLIAAALGAAVAVIACAASALAVTIYVNDFSSASEMKELQRSGGGKACERAFRKKHNTMRVAVKRGETTCSFRTPVVGDSELPNHGLEVDAKILKDTPKSARGGAFVELSLRSGGGGVGYQLRVYPKKRRYVLDRGPEGGRDFPARGESKAIGKINERNRITLSAKGSRVTASVNGEELVRVRDGNPGQVKGRKVRFGIGHGKSNNKDVLSVVRSVAVGTPSR